MYPKIETGFALKPHMNDIYVKTFNNLSFNEDGIENAISGIKYYNPPRLIFQPLPVKEKVKKQRLIGWEMVIYRYSNKCGHSWNCWSRWKSDRSLRKCFFCESFKLSPLRKVIEKLFPLGQKYKDENNDSLLGLVKLVINSLNGVQIRDTNESYYCKSETWMKTEFDENVLEYW